MKLNTSVPLLNVKFIGPVPVVNVTVKSVDVPIQTLVAVAADNVATGNGFNVTTCEPKGPCGEQLFASTKLVIVHVPDTVGVTGIVVGEG